MKAKTITQYKKILWELCKQITRILYGTTCYTCGKFIEKGIHTGHFITSSICSVELRYDLDNLRPQCYACNIHRSGNWTAFETHLISDKGKDFIFNLKLRNEQTKGKQYDIPWYQNKIIKYQDLLSTLQENKNYDIIKEKEEAFS